MDPKTGDLVKGGVAAQTQRALESVKALLEDNNSHFGLITKAQLFLVTMDDFSVVDGIYKSFFKEGDVFPSRAAVAVSSLPKGALFEVIVEAVTDTKGASWELLDKQ